MTEPHDPKSAPKGYVRLAGKVTGNGRVVFFPRPRPPAVRLVTAYGARLGK